MGLRTLRNTAFNRDPAFNRSFTVFKLLTCLCLCKFLIQINDEIMILLPDERYSIEHQVERITKIYKVYIEKNGLKNDGLIEWISLFRQWIS